MKIKQGRYPAKARGLEFELSTDLALFNAPVSFLLQGPNGIGKTTFLEAVLLPAFDDAGVPYLYLGQDLRLQLFTLKALMAVKGSRQADGDMRAVIKHWIEQSPAARILLMDEFDKYFEDYRFIFRWCRSAVQAFFIVSHRPFTQALAPDDALAARVLSFEKGKAAVPLQQVQVTLI
jgi:hypothetical protein